MLLQRLVDRTQHDEAGEPEFFRDRAVRWQLALTGGGDLASAELTDLADPSDKARKNGTDPPGAAHHTHGRRRTVHRRRRHPVRPRLVRRQIQARPRRAVPRVVHQHH